MKTRYAFGQFGAAARRKAALVLGLIMCTLGAGLSATAQDRKATFITFDAPGAGTGVLQGTAGYGTNPSGTTEGNYFDSNYMGHGFLRARDGTITEFDAPGAVDTSPDSMNLAGAITGNYYGSTDAAAHGFVRAPDGTFTTFDVPGAGTGVGQGTIPLNINPAGEISGGYTDASGVGHGFVRARDGAITSFDAPGAGTGPGQGTFLAGFDGMSPAGAIAGSYIDPSGLSHGFVRAPDGAITMFDAPGAGTGPGQGTFSGGINPTGIIPGTYIDASGVNHGYERAPHGAITTFDVPTAGTGSGQGTIAANINPAGEITGYYIDASEVNHGFARARDGSITTFDAPGAGTGPPVLGFYHQGTYPFSNNATGEITGWYVDANGLLHGFVRTP